MRKLVIFCLIGLLVVSALPSHANTPFRVWIAWNVPPDFETMLAPLIASGEYERVESRAAADLELVVTPYGGAITSRWLYVPVVPFVSLADNLAFADIQRYWNGDNLALSYLSGINTPTTLIISASVMDAMTYFLGEPAPTTMIQIVPEAGLIDQLWRQRPNVWSMVAFNDLTPQLKPLTVDGVDILSADFNPDTYPFMIEIGVRGDDLALARAIEDLLTAGTWRGSNRDPQRLTRVVLSGVTALTRATAFAMENQGITLPAQNIMPFLADADVLHTSNEVAFSQQCPYPDPNAGTVFCSDDRYMELLQYIGLDVVELTGNHINDYGPGALKHTLDRYDEVGMAYFGGGHTPDDARAPYIMEHNGNTIAFIGCNVPGPFKAWVSDDRPGAAACDDAYLAEELTRLSAEVDVVIMTVQDFEYYQYNPPPAQVTRFTNYATWGADVVIGSQAHQPQGFGMVEREGQGAAFIHHGLGNLFFDQMDALSTRQMFMDKLVIYDGQVISVELFTGLIESYCCPRPMTVAERQSFLQTIFQASGW
ncbi:MAG: CapA family protein [Anaerolineales bacterium]|nr:CapA family protein [Anaerolineales bacterium]